MERIRSDELFYSLLKLTFTEVARMEQTSTKVRNIIQTRNVWACIFRRDFGESFNIYRNGKNDQLFSMREDVKEFLDYFTINERKNKSETYWKRLYELIVRGQNELNRYIDEISKVEIDATIFEVQTPVHWAKSIYMFGSGREITCNTFGIDLTKLVNQDNILYPSCDIYRQINSNVLIIVPSQTNFTDTEYHSPSILSVDLYRLKNSDTQGIIEMDDKTFFGIIPWNAKLINDCVQPFRVISETRFIDDQKFICDVSYIPLMDNLTYIVTDRDFNNSVTIMSTTTYSLYGSFIDTITDKYTNQLDRLPFLVSCNACDNVTSQKCEHCSVPYCSINCQSKEH